MDCFECFDEQAEFPLELVVDLGAHFVANLGEILLREICILNE